MALLKHLSSLRKECRLARLATLHLPARTENVRCSMTCANAFSCALIVPKLQQETGVINTFREETLDLASPLSCNPHVVMRVRRVKDAVTYLEFEGAVWLSFIFTAFLILAKVKIIHLIAIAWKLRSIWTNYTVVPLQCNLKLQS